MASLTLTNILTLTGRDPRDISVILHRATQPRLREMLPWMVANRPDLFDAYQSVHSDRASATLTSRRFAASFVPLGDDQLVFAGMYEITAHSVMPTPEIYADPRFHELEVDFGATDTGPAQNIAARDTQIRFEMTALDDLNDLVGRLCITAPTGRTYVRLAENLQAPVARIAETSRLIAPMPHWSDLRLTSGQVKNIPPLWRDALRHWRGVYLILDERDGARYVGSASGADNLLGRWHEHVSGPRGITHELRNRSPETFVFTILQRLSPDATRSEVVAAEYSWMKRLGTVTWGLNT